jgi:hypothetical protein
MKADTYLCPGCDQEVAVGSRGCPRCNSPHKRRRRSKAAAGGTRRRERDHSADGLDLPDDDFDYDAFVAREFGLKPHRRIGIEWYWWVTALILVLVMILGIALLGGW